METPMINIGGQSGTGQELWIDAREIAALRGETGYSFQRTHITMRSGEKFATDKYVSEVKSMMDIALAQYDYE